jgi:cyclomaltodextrinase
VTTAAPQWTDTAIWYAVYPLGLTGAPMDGSHLRPDAGVEHRMGRLAAWLDHLLGLGCNGLLLGPIFSSVRHGYDTLDYFAIDPRLGDGDDFDRLIEACRSRGIRVLLDGVFNHVAATYPALVDALASPQAESSDWFHIDYSADPPVRLNFEGSDDLVLLNHDSPAVVKLVGDVMRHWLARGIDGWRLDAAYAVNPEFWARVLPAVRAEYPDAFFVGEVIHADFDKIAASGLTSITAYELWKAVWSSISDRNFFELDWTLTRLNELLDLGRPVTFVGNHDVTRITTRIGPSGALLALVIMMTLGGTPAIYYGDEGGAEGTKFERAGGDDEIRPEMPADPADWVPPVPWLLDAHRALISIRRQNTWLVDARLEKVELTNERYVYRVVAGTDWLEVELDLTGGYLAMVSDRTGQLYRYQDAAATE